MDFGDVFYLSECFPVDLCIRPTDETRLPGQWVSVSDPQFDPVFSIDRRILRCNLQIALNNTFYAAAAYNWNFIMLSSGICTAVY